MGRRKGGIRTLSSPTIVAGLLLVVCMLSSARRGFVSALTPSTSSSTRSTMTTANANKKPTLAFHWFRNDLRVHDNPVLVHSVKNHDVVVPLFVFDATLYGDSARTVPFGSLKWGSKRAKFLLESVHDLRCQLQSRHSGLLVAHGDVQQVFERLVVAAKDSYQVSVVTQDEPLKEERDAVKLVSDVLKRHGSRRVTTVWGSTMYELKDLPFQEGLVDLPDVFTPFRTKVEKHCKIPKPLPVPTFNKGAKFDDILSNLTSRDSFVQESVGLLPTLETLGYTPEQIEYANHVDSRGVMEFVGGERRALDRVKAYIWDDKSLLQSYFETRNGMIGPNYSSKFSPWLALGCLSARHVAMECSKYEEQVIKNKSTYWMVFELLWRDYCKFFCVKHGDKVFYLNGILSDRYNKKWSTFAKNFEAWKHGRTGYPLVDANMRELNATGWMSNRGRQNVCSFLAIDLGHDWRYGGDWFESQLLDYDVYSNWVNWCSGAGMTGGRLNRFNIVKQSKDYDQHGDYVRHWIPELKDVPNQFIHEPWKMTQFEQMQYNVRLGVDYPSPVVPPFQPKPYERGGGSESNSNRGDSSNRSKQRKPNKGGGNRHQKYEMKSLKEGRFELK